MDDQLLLTPWREPAVAPRHVNRVPSMISRDETLYLHWLACCRFTGRGEIVDGGPLFGSSTIAMAKGLRLNERVSRKAGRIFSYDLFQYNPYMQRLFLGQAEPAIGDNIESIFRANIAPWAHLVQVFPGDITQRVWSAGPIEILFIDLAKTWDVQRHLLQHFFPHLIPGVSVVVQQDYFFVDCYWIHLVMEALSDYFRPVHAPYGPTLAFDLIQTIPSPLLEIDYEHHWTKAQAVALMDRAIARFNGEHRLLVMTAKVSLLLAHEDVRGAQSVLAEVERHVDFTEPVRINAEKAKKQIAQARGEPRRRATIYSTT